MFSEQLRTIIHLFKKNLDFILVSQLEYKPHSYTLTKTFSGHYKNYKIKSRDSKPN